MKYLLSIIIISLLFIPATSYGQSSGCSFSPTLISKTTKIDSRDQDIELEVKLSRDQCNISFIPGIVVRLIYTPIIDGKASDVYRLDIDSAPNYVPGTSINVIENARSLTAIADDTKLDGYRFLVTAVESKDSRFIVKSIASNPTCVAFKDKKCTAGAPPATGKDEGIKLSVNADKFQADLGPPIYFNIQGLKPDTRGSVIMFSPLLNDRIKFNFVADRNGLADTRTLGDEYVPEKGDISDDWIARVNIDDVPIGNTVTFKIEAKATSQTGGGDSSGGVFETSPQDNSSYDFEIKNPIKAETFGELFKAVYSRLFLLILPLAVIVIVYSGILMTTSVRDIKQYEKGKEYLQYAILALIIIFIGRGFISLFQSIFNFLFK